MKPVLLGLIALSASFSASAGNWPAWRGPLGTGVTDERNLPLQWSASENVKWRTPLPGPGNSTPIVWEDRVFITQAQDDGRRRSVICFNRTDGSRLWENGVAWPEPETTHETNPQCAASPVTDGERVIASFASAGVVCYDMNGKELWRCDLGKQAHIWGNGASPILHEDLCILNFGPGERTFLIALDKNTGRTVWKVEEPGGHYGEPKPGESTSSVWVGSWSTPILADSQGRRELLMTFPKRLCAFDPQTGRELWTCAGLNPLVYTSPLFADGIAVGMGGFNGPALAVRTGGSGDVTESHRLWRNPKTRQRIGSGVVHDGHIFILDEPGIAQCLKLKTGELVWEERLRGPGANGASWSSLVLTPEGRIYAINQSGDAFIFKAAPKYEILRTNSIGEHTLASLAPSQGGIFIRTHEALWCIAETDASSR